MHECAPARFFCRFGMRNIGKILLQYADMECLCTVTEKNSRMMTCYSIGEMVILKINILGKRNGEMICSSMQREYNAGKERAEHGRTETIAGRT